MEYSGWDLSSHRFCLLTDNTGMLSTTLLQSVHLKQSVAHRRTYKNITTGLAINFRDGKVSQRPAAFNPCWENGQKVSHWKMRLDLKVAPRPWVRFLDTLSVISLSGAFCLCGTVKRACFGQGMPVAAYSCSTHKKWRLPMK